MVLTGTSKARSHVTDLNDEAQAIIFETRQCLKLRAQGGPIKSFKGENMDTQEIKDSTKEPEKKKRRKPVDVSIEALRFLYAYGPLYKSDFIHSSTSAISAVGSNLAITFPALSITNFVKFHLISGFLSQSGSAFANISSSRALYSCS